MANKYDSFIELTPGYESVVDISSDSRDATIIYILLTKKKWNKK